MKNEIITSLERINEKLKSNLKEAKFELMKPKNLVCKFNFIVSDLAGIYTVNTVDSKETNKKHYQLKDCTPSNIARWNKKGVDHIIETYKVEQGVELKAMKFDEFYRLEVEKLTQRIKLNNEMIESFK